LKKFITRSISGFVFAALIIGSIFLGPIALAIVFLAFLIFGLDEFSRISKLKESGSNYILYYSSGIILYFLIVLITWKFLPVSALAFSVLIIFIIMISQVVKRATNPLNNLGIILISLLYIVIPLGILNALFYTDFSFETRVLFTLIGIFSITWLNDTFAYIVGSLIGKTKLAEKISPKKTWEGTIGGLIFGVLGSYILFLIFPDMSLLKWVGFAMITVITGNLGDLFESLLKRSAQTKESGWIIPGHGGVLDRLDSILFAIPFIFLYTYFVI
jgi:phosphatidate cytidylyltransferase